MLSTPKPSHKPRRKLKGDGSSNGSSNGTVITDSSQKREWPAFPLVSFFWPARNATLSQWILLPVILMVTGLFRWCTAIWPYSGMATPPMHGDFEAQRHWMEVTVNLPTTHWYFHDLEWWGLDYPPLTAYHSWILGKIGGFISDDWFALYISRGMDDQDLKVFMRATVIVSEFLVYIPAAVVVVRHIAKRCGISSWEASIALTAILLQPATILIDHGHFQYNTVMLGFVLATMSSMLAGQALWTCVFFVCALGFKQMALFYAPAVAAYLAGICLFPRIDPLRFFGIAAVTVASFSMLFLPLLLGGLLDSKRSITLPTDAVLPPLLDFLPSQLSKSSWYHPYIVQVAQSIHRIFPFSRGLFEDKVANIWCAIHSSGIHKLHNYPAAHLSRAALGLTLIAITPPCLLLFLNPKKSMIVPAMAATAWGFFLCSYQVHEKNVLLPLLPMTLLLSSKDGMKPAIRAWVGYANILACWTMFPLLARDLLRVPYFVLTALWAYLMGLPPFSLLAYTARQDGCDLSWLTTLIHLSTYLAMVAWHVVEYFVPPPANKPDLWLVANACLGAAGFGLCYLWCLLNVADASGFLRSRFFSRPKPVGQKKTQ